jgi:hypothetical protein
MTHALTAMPYRRTTILFLVAATSLTCAPAPKYVACSDDASCQTVDPNYSYCLQKRCVECVTNSGCGMDNRCVEGVCERRCKDRRDCRDGESCTDGLCAN